MSTQRLTGGWVLFDIPGLKAEEQTRWPIRCLGKLDPGGNVRSPALVQLRKWRKERPKEYEKLMRAIRYAAANQIHPNNDLVRKDQKGRDVYEFKNTSCKCRLMFFKYQQEIIICTNTYWKGKGNHRKDQDAAFERCEQLRKTFTLER